MFKNHIHYFFRSALTVVILILQTLFLNVLAQDTVNGSNLPDESLPDIDNLIDADYLSIHLPPLDAFLEAVETAPSVQQAKSYEREQTHRLKVTKNEWMNYIRGTTNYSYGSMGSMTESNATGQGTYFQYFGQVMSLYNVGASITIPIELIFSRNSRIKAQQEQVEQAKYLTLQAIENRKIVISEVYSAVIRSIKLLKVTAEASTIADSNVKMGEFEYINGGITMQEISQSRRDQTLATTSYEDIKTELFKNILRLEILTGINIIK